MADDSDGDRFVPFRGITVIKGWPERVAGAQDVTFYTDARTGIRWRRIRIALRRPGVRRTQPCPDCAAIASEYHVPTCARERCPRCDGQAAFCGCWPELLPRDDTLH